VIKRALIHLTYPAKKALAKGISVGVLTIIVYVVIVVITTPSLVPSLAIKAAFAMKSIIIFGTAIGVGLQFFISSYSRGILDCKLDKKCNRSRGIIGSSTSTTISSFFHSFLWYQSVVVGAGF
jgi:hypothetical protein